MDREFVELESMEDYLHHELHLDAEEAVEVKLNNHANVMLLDDLNFGRYQRREKYTYLGGHTTLPTVRITAPNAGRWHLVVDLGGLAGSISPYYRVLHPA